MKPKAKSALKAIIIFLTGLFSGIFGSHAKEIALGGDVLTGIVEAIPEKESKKDAEKAEKVEKDSGDSGDSGAK